MSQLLSALNAPLLSLGTDLIATQFSAVKGPLERDLNRKSPVTLPPAGGIMQAYAANFIDQATFEYLIGSHGINLLPGEGADAFGIREMYQRYKSGWQAILDMMVIRPNIDQAISANLRGIITPDQFRNLQLHLSADKLGWKWIEDSYRTYLSPGVLASLFWRGEATKADFEKYAVRQGAYDAKTVDWLWELRRQIPDPSQLIRYAQIASLGSPDAGALGLYDGMPLALQTWLHKSGLDWPDEQGVTWSQHSWAAHWQLPSRGEVLRWHKLFRPGRLDRYAAVAPNLAGMSLADVHRWLGMDAIPPGVRDYVVAASYRPMRLQTIQRSYVQGPELAGRRDWARQMLLDASVHPDDVESTLDVWDHTRWLRSNPDPDTLLKQRKLRAIRAMESETVAELEDGLITRQQCIDTLKAGDWTDQSATAYASAIADGAKRRLTAKAVAAVRKEYLLGGHGVNDAVSALRQLGLTDEGAKMRADEWQIELTLHRKQLSAGKLVTLYREGLLSRADVYLRLQRLGWVDPDLTLLLAETELLEARKLAKAEHAAADKLNAEQARTAKALAKAQGHADTLQQALAKQTPRATVLKWYRDRIVSRSWAEQRLALLGLDPQTIAAALADVDATRHLAKPAKHVAGAVPVAASALAEAPPATQTQPVSVPPVTPVSPSSGAGTAPSGTAGP